MRRRVRDIRTIEVPRFGELETAGGRLFALRFRPPQQQPVLVVLPSADRPDEARVLVDLNQIDPSGGTAMDWYEPSLDGRRVAVSLAQGGSERGDVHVYEVDSGRPLADVVPRVNYGTAGGSLAWDARGEGFYYTRYPRQGERPEADLDFYLQVYYHRLGLRPTGPLDPPRPFLPEGEAVIESSFSRGATSRIVPTPAVSTSSSRWVDPSACGCLTVAARSSARSRSPRRVPCTRSCPKRAGARCSCRAPPTWSP